MHTEVVYPDTRPVSRHHITLVIARKAGTENAEERAAAEQDIAELRMTTEREIAQLESTATRERHEILATASRQADQMRGQARQILQDSQAQRAHSTDTGRESVPEPSSRCSQQSSRRR